MALYKHKMPWESLNPYVTATTLASREYDEAVYNAHKYTIPNDVNSITIAFYGTDANNEDAGYILWGRRRTNGPIEKIAAGVVTLGSLAVTKDPITKVTVTAFWADTITDTHDAWLKSPAIAGAGSNDICYFSIDTFGLKDLYLEIDIDGGSNEAASISAIITGQA